MRTSVVDQAVFAALSLVLGFALGLVFDALRAPRAKCRAVGRAALDVLYALIVFTGLFLLGLRSGAGRAGLDSILFAAAGALLYGVTLSPVLAPLFRKLFDRLFGFVHLLQKPLQKYKKLFKNRLENAKKLFPKSRNCIRILYHGKNRASDSRRINTHEDQAGRHHYEDPSSGDRPVRGGSAGHAPRRDPVSAEPDRAARAAGAGAHRGKRRARISDRAQRG
jgi:hypothetical protein